LLVMLKYLAVFYTFTGISEGHEASAITLRDECCYSCTDYMRSRSKSKLSTSPSWESLVVTYNKRTPRNQ